MSVKLTTVRYLTSFVAVSMLCEISTGLISRYKQCNNRAKVMGLVFADSENRFYDVYALGKRSTCGKRAATLRGQGTLLDPYVFSVNLSQGLTRQQPDCGVQDTGNATYTLTVRTLKTCSEPSAADVQFSETCSLTLPPSVSAPERSPTKMRVRASHLCRQPGSIEFHYSQSVFQPFDIYAVDGSKSCSRCSGLGRGSGTSTDPFVFTVNITDNTRCGIQVNEGVYRLRLLVQQAEFAVQNSDIVYKVECNFSSIPTVVRVSSASISVGGRPITRNVTEASGRATLMVVDEKGEGMHTVTVGDAIRLRAELLEGVVAGLRVTSCLAKPSEDRSPEVRVLDEHGCSTKSQLVPSFHGDGKDGRVVETDLFQAFKFSEYSTIYFRCHVQFCYNHNDKKCANSHCADLHRHHRSVDEDKTHIIVAHLLVQSSSKTNGGILLPTDQKQADQQILWNRGVIAAVTFMGALTLLCIVLLVVVFCRFRKHQRHVERRRHQKKQTSEPCETS